MKINVGDSSFSIERLLEKTKWAIHNSIKNEKLLLQMIAR
jgi:hypothetical protein